ncbi:MAG TPA: formate/nitrite transporter family protein [Candidatus Ratteibacteria bacterium]|nr:formate/nitrite transporter family protein [bacterium]HRS06144.1 formate/nitrite transporter family protein [Candidatus Ratteibacteria bacterium]HRV03866.1 formate/nitrite transporter family protein [Candidatus Ratteibacteria bacterium]
MGGFLTPEDVARSMVETSKKKASLGMLQMWILGILAGVYIGFGAHLCTMVSHDLSQYLGYGFTKFIAGSVFTVGLMLVIIGGAELFTGNCLIFTAVVTGDVQIKDMLKNWLIVYIANFIGAMLLVLIVYYSGLWKVNNYGAGLSALNTATAKVNISFVEAFCRGIGCNWLVCLAVWLAAAGKDSISKIFGIYFPIMAFVASGFEHSIANMFFIPIGIFLKNNPEIIGRTFGCVSNLTWYGFILNNLVPVTLGNIVGGALFVGGAYYLVYLHGVKS